VLKENTLSLLGTGVKQWRVNDPHGVMSWPVASRGILLYDKQTYLENPNKTSSVVHTLLFRPHLSHYSVKV